jgi:phosphoenolpyruvate carboxylase
MLNNVIDNHRLTQNPDCTDTQQFRLHPASVPLKYPMPDHPLWSEGAQAARLAELTADTADPAKELPLRRDVRSLGILLGRVLVEQEGEAFLGTIERLRQLLIQHREHSPSDNASEPDHRLMAQAREMISGLSVEDAYRVTKAFAIYFELTNLAETNHRKRRRRAARMLSDETLSGKAPVEGSFRGTLLRIRDSGVSADAMLEALHRIKVTPVFTAHPTEISRHTVRLKRRRIAAYLQGLDQLPLSDSEAREYESLILAEITALWQTDEVRLNKPTVRDEIHMGLDYFPMILFETLPRLFAELEESVRDVYGADADFTELLSPGPACRSDPCRSDPCPSDVSDPCPSDHGSVATATAIPTSPPPRRAKRSHGAPRNRRSLHRRNHA